MIAEKLDVAASELQQDITDEGITNKIIDQGMIFINAPQMLIIVCCGDFAMGVSSNIDEKKHVHVFKFLIFSRAYQGGKYYNLKSTILLLIMRGDYIYGYKS